MDNYSANKKYSNSNTGYLKVSNSRVRIENDDVTSCEYKNSDLIHHTSKEGRFPTTQKEKNNLITIYGKRKNVARFLPRVVESHANTENEEWKDEKEEQLQGSKRGGGETKLEAYDGVEEIKVTNNVSYVTTTTNHHYQRGNWIVRCPTITEKRLWWNLGLFSPTISEISSIPSSVQQERYNNNSLLEENEEVSEKRAKGGKYNNHYHQKKQEKKQFHDNERQGIRRNSANRLKQFTNNYKLDGPRDENRLAYICDINDKQKVDNASSAVVAAAATNFVAADSYYDDCVRNQQPLIEKNVNNNKHFYSLQQQQNHDVRNAQISFNAGKSVRPKNGCTNDLRKTSFCVSPSLRERPSPTTTQTRLNNTNHNNSSQYINRNAINLSINSRKHVCIQYTKINR